MAGRFLVVAAVAVVALMPVCGLARADTITMQADEWCPFDCGGTTGTFGPGYGVEVAQVIFAKAGHKVEFTLAPWNRSLEDCLHGLVTSVIGAAPVDSPELIFPTEPIGVWDTTFVVRKGDPWRYQGIDSLARVKLGGILGYIYMEPVAAYVDAHRDDRSRVDLVGGRNPTDANLRKLLAGRIDTAMEARAVLDYKLKSLGLSGSVDFAGGTPSGPIYIAFSPKHPKAREYARLLDEGIARMRASGELKAILDRYGVSDWK